MEPEFFVTVFETIFSFPQMYFPPDKGQGGNSPFSCSKRHILILAITDAPPGTCRPDSCFSPDSQGWGVIQRYLGLTGCCIHIFFSIVIKIQVEHEILPLAPVQPFSSPPSSGQSCISLNAGLCMYHRLCDDQRPTYIVR